MEGLGIVDRARRRRLNPPRQRLDEGAGDEVPGRRALPPSRAWLPGDCRRGRGRPWLGTGPARSGNYGARTATGTVAPARRGARASSERPHAGPSRPWARMPRARAASHPGRRRAGRPRSGGAGRTSVAHVRALAQILDAHRSPRLVDRTLERDCRQCHPRASNAPIRPSSARCNLLDKGGSSVHCCAQAPPTWIARWARQATMDSRPV